MPAPKTTYSITDGHQSAFGRFLPVATGCKGAVAVCHEGQEPKLVDRYVGKAINGGVYLIAFDAEP